MEQNDVPMKLNIIAGRDVAKSFASGGSGQPAMELARSVIRKAIAPLVYFSIALGLVFLCLNSLGLAKPIIQIVLGSSHFLQFVLCQAMMIFYSTTGWALLAYPLVTFIIMHALYNWLNSFSYATSVQINDDGVQIGWAHGGKKSLSWDDIGSVFLFRPNHTMLPKKWLVGFGTGGPRPVTIRLPVFESKGQQLLNKLKEKAPWMSIDPALIELWEPVIADNHTELWLKSLSQAPKGSELMPLFPGAMLQQGRFAIQHRLGIGGQGTAYLAEDRSTSTSVPTEDEMAALSDTEGEAWTRALNDNCGTECSTKCEVVIKETIFPLYVDERIRQEAEKRFNLEIQLLSRLNHPQVVKLHESFIEGARGYLVLEYIKGESLRQRIKRVGPMVEAEVLDLAAQMADILRYLHGLAPAIIHRDFTPDNLMLTDDNKLKLIDFNVAREAESTRTATVVGKHAYLPPEQFRGEASTQSDIYAMGATLYFLLTGEDPEPISQSFPAEVCPAVSEFINNMVAKCTCIDLDGRYSRAEEILAEFSVSIAQKELVPSYSSDPESKAP